MLKSLIGIGLRQPHYHDFLSKKPRIGWVEVHSENYLGCGGISFDFLLKIRADYPVSLHGIGMSLGSSDGLDIEHLRQVKKLIDIIEPCLVSEHLSWSSHNEHFLPELLPSPYNAESLQVFADNIAKAQEFLNRNILLENPSTYLEYKDSSYQEADFLNLLADKTGCGILLDINNIYVSGQNNGWPAIEYLAALGQNHVKEIHLAGHSHYVTENNKKLLIDTHDDIVCQEVWDLYARALSQLGGVPTLIEWDAKIPDLEILLSEARKAESLVQKINDNVYV